MVYIVTENKVSGEVTLVNVETRIWKRFYAFLNMKRRETVNWISWVFVFVILFHPGVGVLEKHKKMFLGYCLLLYEGPALLIVSLSCLLFWTFWTVVCKSWGQFLMHWAFRCGLRNNICCERERVGVLDCSSFPWKIPVHIFHL